MNWDSSSRFLVDVDAGAFVVCGLWFVGTEGYIENSLNHKMEKKNNLTSNI